MNLKLLLLLAFIGMVNGFDPSTYPNKVVFKEDYTMYWRMNGDKIQFGLAVNTLGWIGFGISEATSGSMPGGDIAVISYSGNKPVITDHHALAFAYPPIDNCQNWVLLSHTVQNGVITMVEIERLLDTGDSQDRVFEAGTMMMIYAYGLDTQLSLTYHESRRGIYGVEYWRNPIAQPDPTETDLMETTFTIGNFEIPRRTTTYACIAHKIPIDRLDGDHHIVRVEPVLDPRTTGITHHMLVHVCIDSGPLSWSALFLDEASQCISPIGMPFSGCSSLLYGWAMGIEELNFPPEAGARMGYGRGTFQYIVIEMHYDNPNGIAGLVDNTGYKIYYTKNLRPHDAASLTVGDPYISFPNIPPKNQGFGLEATCPSECTSKFTTDLYLFGSALHMHVAGAQMWTTVYRDDKYMGTISRADFFSFDNQHLNYVNFTIKPGDRLNTHCVFNTVERVRPTGFGYASFNEMCMDFLNYWPRQEFGLGGHDFAYCGYFGYTREVQTLCGSNQAFLTGQSILPVSNPIVSDMEQTREIQFGKAPANCPVRS